MQQWKIGMEIFLYLIYFIPWLLFHYSMQQKNQQLTIAVIMITMDSTKRNEISKGGCQEIIRNRVTSKGSGRRSSWYLMIRIWYLIEFYCPGETWLRSTSWHRNEHLRTAKNKSRTSKYCMKEWTLYVLYWMTRCNRTLVVHTPRLTNSPIIIIFFRRCIK